MLKFLVLDNGRPAANWPIRNAYLLGSDGNAMRGAVTYEHERLVCHKREVGASALALQVPVGECGELTLQTCLLPERDEPYLLSLELARHRVMLLYNKSEDWGMFDIRTDHPVNKRIEHARRLFVEALCHQGQDLGRCDQVAKECLRVALEASEELALTHAELLLGRRRQTGALPRRLVGAGVNLEDREPRLREGLVANFDFTVIPTRWRELAPEEGDYHWEPLDDWINWAARSRMPIIAGPLLSFDPRCLPDWFFLCEHDYEGARDLIYEHIERVVGHLQDRVDIWTVISGLHLNTHFVVAFDQLMDLSRMATMLVKKLQPRARLLVEIRQPFGEYYGKNQRSIPPMMYLDLLVQGAIHFDSISLKLLMGQPMPGQFVRDLMQISHLLDQYAAFGKPLQLVVAAPSEPVTEEMVAVEDPAEPADIACGVWRRPWSPQVQGRWFEAVLHMALSKPFVESVIWNEVVDHPAIEMPLGGVVTEDLQPRYALQRLAVLRRALAAPLAPAGGQPAAARPGAGG